MRTRALLFASFLVISPPVAAQNDWFEQMDQQFEETFTQTDALFNQALRDGVEELDQQLEKIWGESRRLPEPKVWVGYDHDMKTRFIVDYDKGEISVESQTQSPGALRRTFDDFLNNGSNFDEGRDLLKQKIIEKTRKIRTLSTRKIKPTPWRERPRFRDLAEPRANPRIEKRNYRHDKGRTLTLNRISLPLRDDRDRYSADSLSRPVLSAARAYDLPPSLIFSMIKNESSFNPKARSRANALGLMQLVPTSGGREAYHFLTGENRIPDPELLYNPIENVRLGTAYLHILATRYFGRVKDPRSRQYLIIAAYNTGAGNVARAFTGTKKLTPTIAKINTMSAQSVFEHLQKHLPYDETKTYLVRVTRDRARFQSWDDAA